MGSKEEMIHLDTNCLIGLVTSPSPLEKRLLALLYTGDELVASAVAWSEFLNGPVTPQQIKDAFGMVDGRIIPFGLAEAEVAAQLFNRTGRKRGSKPDCFIAATAICAKMPVATANLKDFQPFVPLGLKLA